MGGRNVTGRPPHELSRLDLNHTVQVSKSFGSLPVRQNVGVALGTVAAVGAMAEDVLALVGLGPLADRAASSLNTAQQKLFDLGHALATDPRLLLVDELGAGLSPADL